jgi:hypothetical protein
MEGWEGTRPSFCTSNSYLRPLSSTQAVTSIHRPSVLTHISLSYMQRNFNSRRSVLPSKETVHCLVHPQRRRCCAGCKDLVSVTCCVTHRIIWCHAHSLQSGQSRYVSYSKHLLQLRNTQFSYLAWPTNTNNPCLFCNNLRLNHVLSRNSLYACSFKTSL